MKLKIGSKIFTAADGPIMVILTDQDKLNIANMAPGAIKYCVYQDDMFTPDEIRNWMMEE